MAHVVKVPGAIDEKERVALLETLATPKLVGESQLKGTFRGSRGFGIAMRADAEARVLERFPGLRGFLALLGRGGPLKKLARWPRVLPAPNAYYLNLLVVDDGHGVGPHVDGTLGDPAGVEGATPEVVSALYLRVPKREAGGRLVLARGAVEVASVQPEERLLVHFRGDLAHEVEPLVGADGPRISLICEQYCFEPEALARLDPMRLQSRARDPVFAPGPCAAACSSDRTTFADLLERRALSPQEGGTPDTSDPATS